ncbi:class I SAM-dependent methyltransferase [Candidatus Entotheonella palauensis]|uniref:class I SAM-dependent methyltransferase n=1 Tax=Candidatus Entotheonella palauensis TaxID=93172 RepID=UPI0015C41B1D|nr:class I SAM-dependent methyltransferase [Candidatus Entotheonella palauensis]
MSASNLTNQAYLQNDQYKDASNFNARLQLHERYSLNKEGLHRWVFEQLDVPQTCRILELGCGAGELWWQNRERLPPDWAIVLSDFSPGMLHEAQHKLRPCNHLFTWLTADAQQIPLTDASVDAIIANHMLYHVPDLPRCMAEIHRVLKPGGRLYAVTNGARHLQQLGELYQRFGSREKRDDATAGLTFHLGNGEAHLAPWMTEVHLKRFDDALVVDEAEPVLAYMCSGLRYQVEPDRVGPLRAFLEQEIARHGAIRVDKDVGMFEAIR